MQHTKSETIHEVCKAFSLTFKTAQAMLKLIQTSDKDGDVGIVHTGKRRIKLAAEQVTMVTVKANAGAQFRGQDPILVPSEEPTLPEGITVEQGLITVPNERIGYVKIPIANCHNVGLLGYRPLDGANSVSVLCVVST